MAQHRVSGPLVPAVGRSAPDLQRGMVLDSAQELMAGRPLSWGAGLLGVRHPYNWPTSAQPGFTLAESRDEMVAGRTAQQGLAGTASEELCGSSSAAP